MESLKTIIQDNPLDGFVELQELIRKNKLIQRAKDFLILPTSTLEVRVCDGSDWQKPLEVCVNKSQIQQALEKYPYFGKAAKKLGSKVWEYRIFTNGSSKGVNVWCAFSHKHGFDIK